MSWSFSTAGGSAATSLFPSAIPSVSRRQQRRRSSWAWPSPRRRRAMCVPFATTSPLAARAPTPVRIWGPNGQRLAQVTFGGETASGWQRAALSTPVAITPGTVYTVSYLAPQGRYAYTPQAISSPVTSGALTAISPDNGRFRYGSGGAVPTDSWNSTNYFVDVEFVSRGERSRHHGLHFPRRRRRIGADISRRLLPSLRPRQPDPRHQPDRAGGCCCGSVHFRAPLIAGSSSRPTRVSRAQQHTRPRSSSMAPPSTSGASRPQYAVQTLFGATRSGVLRIGRDRPDRSRHDLHRLPAGGSHSDPLLQVHGERRRAPGHALGARRLDPRAPRLRG